MSTSRLLCASLAVALLAWTTPRVTADTVEWSGLGVPSDSWEVGGNWVGGEKPTVAQEAYIPLGSFGKTIYLDANQAAASLRNSADHVNALIALRGANGNDKAYSLTLAEGDITLSTAGIALYAPVILGDADAVWTATSPLELYSGVTETLPNTTIAKLGTSVAVGSGLTLRSSLNITGSLWIREGLVLASTGSSIIVSPGPSHNIRLGDTSGTADAYFSIPSAATCYADFIVESGSSGTRSIATAHTYNGGKYEGDFTLNGYLTLPAAFPSWLSGDWSGNGGVRKTAGYLAGFTGHLSYSGITTVSAGGLVIAGATTTIQLGATGTPGTSTTYDTIAIDGDLTLGGTFNILRLTGYDGAAGVYEIATYTGSLTDKGVTVTGRGRTLLAGHHQRERQGHTAYRSV